MRDAATATEVGRRGPRLGPTRKPGHRLSSRARPATGCSRAVADSGVGATCSSRPCSPPPATSAKPNDFSLVRLLGLLGPAHLRGQEPRRRRPRRSCRLWVLRVVGEAQKPLLVPMPLAVAGGSRPSRRRSAVRSDRAQPGPAPATPPTRGHTATPATGRSKRSDHPHAPHADSALAAVPLFVVPAVFETGRGGPILTTGLNCICDGQLRRAQTCRGPRPARRASRGQGHFTPTSASWLSMVEIWFGIIERQAIRRDTFRSVKELNAEMRAVINGLNYRDHLFVWTKTADHPGQRQAPSRHQLGPPARHRSCLQRRPLTRAAAHAYSPTTRVNRH